MRRTSVRGFSGLLLAVAAMGLVACGTSSSKTKTASGQPQTLIGKAGCSANQAVGTVTYVSPFGFDASAGIIDVFAAQKLGYFTNMCLKVDFVTNSQNSTELVSAGRAEVSNIGSAADDLGQVANGSNIVAVATYGDTSDYDLLTTKNIASLNELAGKSLGYHFTVPVTILEVLHAAKVDVSKVKLINTTNYDPHQLVQGKFDAIQAYRSNEPLVLRADNSQFNEFIPSQFGVKGTFNVQIFNKGFVDQHPSTVADFMRAELHAFDYCNANQAVCVSIEQQYASAAGSEFDVAHEQAVWKFESGLARDNTLSGKGVGVQTTAEWKPEADAIVQYGIVKQPPNLASAENTSIVAGLYHGTKLIWP